MWPRVSQTMLGIWLLISPFVFRHSGADLGFWVTDLLMGSLAIVLGNLSRWRPTRYAHLVLAAAAVTMVLYVYVGYPRPGPPAAQNELCTGLLLAMLGILPNHAALPPESWRCDAPQ